MCFIRRRTPKRNQQISTLFELEPEKLAKEAFRLLRTVQNLMNTHEPSLLHFDAQSNPIKSESESSSSGSTSSNAAGFIRKINSRESRLSMRSSTDESSVHSSSGDAASTKNETDEDMCIPVPPPSSSSVLPPQPTPHPAPPSNQHQHQPKEPSSSAPPTTVTIDDESGFSSMNSFQDIGLPLVNSTMRSTSASSDSSSSSTGGENGAGNECNNAESNSSSIQEKTVINVKDKIGIPRIAHRRWDSAPVTTARLQLSADVSSQVLWV